jgi:hypothetical protein
MGSVTGDSVFFWRITDVRASDRWRLGNINLKETLRRRKIGSAPPPFPRDALQKEVTTWHSMTDDMVCQSQP